MFASKTPRDLIEHFNAQAEAHLNLAGLDPNNDALWDQQVQEEIDLFNSEKHNEPNPILVEVREVKASRGITYGDAWRAFSTAYTYSGHYIMQDFTRITDGPTLVHAYKVLSRLALLEARA